MKHIIPENQTLLEALQHYFPDSSNRTLKNWISFGRVEVDGIPQKANTQLAKGQVLTLKQKETQGPFPILFQDRSLVVIHKPAGLLSVPDDGGSINALDLLKVYLRQSTIYAVHRLDMETSGVLLFAKGKKAEEKFDEMFEKHELKREYAAIVEGRMSQDKGTWESYLKERENYDMFVTSPEEGKRAVTHFEVLRRSPTFSYVRFHLETGKKHQIRVQSADAGYPVAGDFRYGALGNPIKRVCLHAYLLEFIHPFTGKPMRFTAPLPKGFQTLGFPSMDDKTAL